ncbi:MAG: NAD-dependent epimerase/dehydratase family protein [Ilumatobacteraceae bacterium]
MRALVLGGSVFVGRRLVERLVTGGHQVAVLNRGVTPTALPDGVEHLVADRTDMDAMSRVLSGRQWDAIFDVSGFVMVAGGGDIAGLLDLVDGLVGHYVYVSSIMAYDQSQVGVFPWHEELDVDRGGPRSYGGFKAMAEGEMLRRHASTGFPVTIVRPAAIYGPYNNIYDMETPMFLRLIQRRPILVPHSGLVTGSYGHVDDLCRMMIDLIGVDVAKGEIFNATSEAVTTMHYVTTLSSIVGVEPDVVMVPDVRPEGFPTGVYGHLFGERHHAVLSMDKARRLLGFEPELGFEDGHRDTYAWFKKQGWDRLDGPLSDPVWRSSWDFDAETRAAKMLRGS